MYQPSEERNHHKLKKTAARIFGVGITFGADIGAPAKEITHLHEHKRPKEHDQAR